MIRRLSFALFSLPTLLFAAVEIGKPAPDFSLPGIDGKTYSLAAQRGKIVVLEWVNYECPFVKKHYGSGNMQALQKKYAALRDEKKGSKVVWLAINSSAAGKQGNYAAKDWPLIAKEKGSAATTVLLDPGGKVGHAYDAATTPHMFVIDAKGTLAYAGAIDDKPTADPRDVKKARNHVSSALDELLAGKPVSVATSTAYGCAVKY